MIKSRTDSLISTFSDTIQYLEWDVPHLKGEAVLPKNRSLVSVLSLAQLTDKTYLAPFSP